MTTAIGSLKGVRRLFSFLAYPFMVKGLVASVISGGVCSIVGVFVVLNGLSLIGAGLANASFAGVALAFLTGQSPPLFAMGAGAAMAVGLSTVGEKSRLRMDTALGIGFSVAMALAILFVGLMRTYPPEMMGYLFGNLLSVSWGDVRVMSLSALVVVTVFGFLMPDLKLITMDEETAQAMGRPVRLVKAGLLLSTAFAIVISLQAVGELMVVALLTIPAAAALQMSTTLRGTLLLSTTIGIVSSVGGLILAFYLDVPSGATIVLILALVVALATVLSGLRRDSSPRGVRSTRSLASVAVSEVKR